MRCGWILMTLVFIGIIGLPLWMLFINIFKGKNNLEVQPKEKIKKDKKLSGTDLKRKKKRKKLNRIAKNSRSRNRRKK
jgi:hypothetical protein